MPFTINYKPGEIILVPFPFTDLTAQKQRPCLIVSSEQFNIAHSDIIAIAITSQIPEKVSEWEYLFTTKELKQCGLPKSSIIKLGKIVTLDSRLIRKRLGKLSLTSFKKVLVRVRRNFKI